MRRITKLWTTLLLLCVVGVANAATEYEIDQKFTTLAELDGNFFAIADETAQTAMGIGVSGHNNGWDMYFGTYTETYAANACYYKLEAAQGDGVEGYYYLRTYKADGNMYTAWGNTSTMGFFNSQAATGTCCFALGVSDKNGQDITNGAVWAIEASEGKFALKNIGTGLYLHSDNLPAKYEDAFYFTFCTLKAGAEVPDPDPEPEPDAPLADGEIIPDFFSICGEGDIPYGYNVNFNSEDRAYPKHYDGGPRIFIFGEGGDFTRGIYFREGYVQYGNVKKLALEAGKKYVVYFNSAMWKSSGTTLEFSIFKEDDLENAVLTQTINNTPDLNGSKAAVTGSTKSEIEFTPEAAGNYILKWNAEGWKEVVLANVGVKVIEAAPVAQNVTFDFNAANHATSSNDSQAGDITENEVNTVDGVVMTISPADEGANTPNRYWGTNNGPQLRMYSGKMTIEAPEGKAITKVVIDNGKWDASNTFNGEAAAEATWEGNSTNVVLAVAANSRMNKVIVTLADKNEETTTYEEAVEPEDPIIDPADLAQIAKKAEMVDEITTIDDLIANKFMLQHAEDGLLLCALDAVGNSWDINAPELLNAVGNEKNGAFFQLETLGEHYQLAMYNVNGERRKYWSGDAYVNAQPDGNVIFGLSGAAPQYGQDGQNLALWDVTYEEGKGFAFHCVGRNIYIGETGNQARPSETTFYWKAYKGYNAGYNEAEILAACKSVSTVLKTKDDVVALEAAKTAYADDKNLDKLGDAVNAAIAAFKACDALNQANAKLDATGAPVAAEVLAKYEAGDYANVAELTEAYVAAVKAQSTAGANMTLAIVNPSFEAGNINGWTSQDGGNAASNGNFLAATGKYFVEKWTNSANGGKLSDGSLLQTITGIPNGKYIVKAEMQNREQGNADAAGKGYFLVANDGKTEGVTNDGKTIEAAGVVTDSTLTIGTKIEGCSGNWVCVDNFQLIYCGAVASEAELADLAAEIAIAKSLNVDVTAYENGVFTAAEVPAAIEALKVAEYAQVNKDYTVNAAVLVPDFAQWEGDMVSNKGQHWDGTGTSLYYEQTGAQWGQSAWTNNKKTTVTLPKGKYVLYAAGRASAGTACSAYMKVNDVTRTYTSKGDVGFGVATNGAASFDPAATYANGNKGRGFEYRYVAFEVTADAGEEIALEIGGEATAEHQWMSFTAPVLLTTEDNVAIMIPVLNGKIVAAKADLEAIKGTVGDGLFQKPQAAYDEYAAAVAAAEPFVAEGATPTAEEIKTALAAIDAKAEAFANAPVIAPDADKAYTFQLRLDGETPLYMALAEGGITIAEEATPLKFVAAETAGQYNLADEANTLFVGLAGGNAWTMSTAADKKANWTFTALPDGAYRINNLVTAGRFVGTNAAEKAAGSPCYADKQVSNGNVDWIITAIIPEVAHTWNFTKWSEETVANLKAEAVKVTVVDDPDNAGKTLCTDNDAQWSDHEKKPGTACETYAASKDNCFWSITTPDENGELAANGVTIAELKGLSFNSTYSAGRSLAIAVNYPSTSLGTYNGPAYLWFGGKNQEILTIKNVKAGSLISIGVESHNITKARGVKLLVGETELTDPEGNAVAVPTTYVEQTWAVPAGEGVVDVVVKNTDGCHIYFIDAEIGEAAPEVNPDEAEKEVPEGWENLIANGNMAGDDVSNFFSKEAPAGNPYASTITPGAGKDNSRGIIIKSAEGGSQDWDSQFFIRASKAIPAGTKLHMEFDYKASVDAKVGTQGHGEPGAYVNNDGVGDVNFTTEWQHLAQDFTASGDIQTIAFNMNILRDEAEYYIDNIVFWAEKAPEIEWADVIVNGTMEENDAFNFVSKIYPDTNPIAATFTAGAGKDGSQGVKIDSPAKVEQDWDTQFWVVLPIALEQGTRFKLEFDYKADAAVTSSAQYHAAPGDYIGNWVNVDFTTEWQHFEKQAIAPAANGNGNKFQSIAFNLSFDNATNLYFDNVKLFLDKETAATAIKTVNTEVPFIEGAVYDLQGRRVAKPARGLYIINGKKVMVK